MEIVDGHMSETPVVQDKVVSDLLCQLDTHRAMDPDGFHPRVMRELTKVLTGTGEAAP